MVHKKVNSLTSSPVTAPVFLRTFVRVCVGIGLLLTSSALLLSCAQATSIGLVADDNNPQHVQSALALQSPVSARQHNSLGKPLAFVVLSGGKTSPKTLVAFSMNEKKRLWEISDNIASKIAVAGSKVTYFAGGEVIARDVGTGAIAWRRATTGSLAGLTSDADRVYVSTRLGQKQDAQWTLTALSATTGKSLWDAESSGAMGAPTVSRGLVFTPYLKQWLTVLDAKNGDQVSRIRASEHDITFAKADAGQVYYGSQRGIFAFDTRAATGKKETSTYGQLSLPEAFQNIGVGPNAFDPIQSRYSAYDRSRVLWTADAKEKKLDFGRHVVVHAYRFFFGLNAANGELAWAYSHPRFDAVASSRIGDIIAFVSTSGEMVALDSTNGKVVYTASVVSGVSSAKPQRVIGASFDAIGWTPSDIGAEPTLGTSEKTTVLSTVLSSIAGDRDARFIDIKRYCLRQLETADGPDVTPSLISIVQDTRSTSEIRDLAADTIVKRGNRGGLPYLLTAIETPYSFINGSSPQAVGPLSKGVASIVSAPEISVEEKQKAIAILITALFAPQTKEPDVAQVAVSLGTIGGSRAQAALRKFVLLYRGAGNFVSADTTNNSATADSAVAQAVFQLWHKGSPKEREFVRFVAADAHTTVGVKEYANSLIRSR